ncbi:MAG: LUD domain-containing protein [Deltaproteobacteria bacterium]|nr:LUD domain-containing protein [Deltaproteobacteria bacterium]
MAHPGAHPAPAMDASWHAFAAGLASVGGAAYGPVARTALAGEALGIAREWAAGGRVVAEPSAAALLADPASPVPPGLELASAQAAPHAFADVAVAIVRGEVAAGECGAVAVLGRDAPQRALLFLAERVLILLDATRVAGDLHTAFRLLPPDALAAHHLTWISGPSKTADIEQTLVFGAHGPRGLAVLGYGDHARP